MTKNLLGFLLIIIIYSSCSPVSKYSLTKKLKATENKFHEHTGFVLYDLKKEKTVYEYNGAKYFIPGSNTKIFTLYASLKIIGDSIPALKYVIYDDSLIFQGAGDPSFLYKNVYNNNRVFNFLKSAKQNLYFSPLNLETTHFGRGWAWDDYNDSYATERFSFPVYGNIFTLYENKKDTLVSPSYFKKFVRQVEGKEKVKVVREINTNQTIYYYDKIKRNRTWDIPFKVDPLLVTTLLSDTLHRPVYQTNQRLPFNAKTLYSLSADSLYRVMMQASDNFIAEQLLLTCSGVLSDTLKPEIAIKYVREKLLNDLIHEPIWIDGSGLSRYNLFTPISIVQLWQKIYNIIPQERLFSLLATGGKKGTLSKWYKADVPYVFGKTGSLSNNHCLSGFLITKHGHIFIFAFMNNNFAVPINDVKQNMQDIISCIYEKR